MPIFLSPEGTGTVDKSVTHFILSVHNNIFYTFGCLKKKNINRKSKPHNFVLCYYRIKDYLIRENQIVTKNVLSTNRSSYPFIVFGNVNL